jgi:iron complex outermembrane receptor protein
MNNKFLLTQVVTLSIACLGYANTNYAQSVKPIDEVSVYADAFFKDTTAVSPSSVITAEELNAINISTVEDTLAHEPSLIIRKRFIGDPNGVVGIRGTNMFQTPRTMVFVDGMPLHYHLQTRFRGSPRWSLVSPDEIERAEVVYGPYSAEYSGNAIGGVVNFRTRRPTTNRFTVELGSFSQNYDQLLTDENYDGYRAYTAYEDKIGDLGFMFSFTRLDNESQPQTQFFRQVDRRSDSTAFANGAIVPTGVDTEGGVGIFFGDSGPESAQTDLFKGKFFYDLENAELRGSIAYEERSRVEDQRNNFLLDSSGKPIFDREVDVLGQNFDTSNFGTSVFQNRNQERESLLVGLGASFELKNNWVGDAFFSHFDVLKDTEVRTGANPDDPNFRSVNERNRARITEYDDTGWNIFDLKFATDSFAGNDNQRLSIGLHYDSYELDFIVDNYNSIAGQRAADELDGDRGTGRSDSGGEAQTLAAFAQYGVAISERWDLSLGVRYDDWEGENGYVGATNSADRSENGVSTKASIAYAISNNQSVRYSVAEALRFPVIEEVFVNNASVRGGSVADASISPEDGVFHNLSYQRSFDHGSFTINLFHEDVEDTIFNQTSVLSGVTTFLPIDRVKTDGAELVVALEEFAGLPLDLRFNTTYTDAKIVENRNNPAFIGRDFPRIPEWRANLIVDYQVSGELSLGGSLRHASDTFGELDNSDTVNDTFGAHTKFTFVGVKANWQITPELNISAGIDNLFDQKAYVFHPWPGQTFHLNLKYSLSGS